MMIKHNLLVRSSCTTTCYSPRMNLIICRTLLLVALKHCTEAYELPTRRSFIKWSSSLVPLSTWFPPLLGFTSSAGAVTGPADGNLPDLPSDAVRSYLQYRIPLQTAADFYVFELQDLLQDPSDYGEVNELFEAKSARGGGNPSRIEREFTNTFRILGLSMPPDFADEILDAQYRFDKAMTGISRTTAGIRRDLPIEIDAEKVVSSALAGWEDGRKAINDIFSILNEATGLSEMKGIPAAGPNQLVAYGRSQRRFLDLKKKLKLCQNRGGQTLASTWGNLMVAGTVSDYCALPDPNDYFYQ